MIPTKYPVIRTPVSMMGMDLMEWRFISCVAHIAEGGDWATVYDIESEEQGKGHATTLLKEAKEHYESQGKRFGSTTAIHPAMKHLLQKLNIHEYD